MQVVIDPELYVGASFNLQQESYIIRHGGSHSPFNPHRSKCDNAVRLIDIYSWNQ